MTKEEFMKKVKSGYGLSEQLQNDITQEQLEKSMEDENYKHIPRID